MKLTIFNRLLFSQIVIVVMIFVWGGYVTVSLNRLTRTAESAAAVHGQAVRLASYLSNAVFSQATFQKKYLISGDSDYQTGFTEAAKAASEYLSQLTNTIDTAQWNQAVQEIQSNHHAYTIRFGPPPKGQSKTPEMDTMADDLQNRIGQLTGMAAARRDAGIADVSRISARILKVTAIMGLLVVMGIGLIVYFVSKGIDRSISRLKEQTHRIADGYFDLVESVGLPPEFGALAADFNVMARKLSELDEMKQGFISRVSHELRTPLTAIKEASGMLADDTFRDRPDHRRELLGVVKIECNRLIAQVNRILDLARMEAGMMDYRLVAQKLPSLVRGVLLRLAPIAQKKRIDLSFEPPLGIPAVSIDADRIDQVLGNLIGNALNYTPEEGSVAVAIEIHPSGSDHVRVSVSDTGPGIDPDDLAHIFDRFRRGRSTVGHTEGTGMGLAMAKQVVEDHGGQIWVESEKGQGSTFFFILPVTRTKKAGTATPGSFLRVGPRACSGPCSCDVHPS